MDGEFLTLMDFFFYLLEKSTYFPWPNLREHMQYEFDFMQFGPRLYSGRDLAGLAGSLNYLVLLEERLYPIFVPVYRASDKLGLSDLVRISFFSQVVFLRS